MVIKGTHTRTVVETLLKTDLGFHAYGSDYGVHSLHAFAAKFPPQLPHLFIEALTEEGQLVLDPMAGSGTAVVEAVALGRKGIAIDIDPLAVMIITAKCSPPPVDVLLASIRKVLDCAQKVSDERKVPLWEAHRTHMNPATREFIDYWFTHDVQKSLVALIYAIRQEADSRTRLFLEVLFSSIIVTKSGGVSMARDLAHTRPHRDDSKIPSDPLKEFHHKGVRVAAKLKEWHVAADNAVIIQGDARSLPLADNTVDLIVTSPPYANAIDYMRAHKFSLVWLGHSIDTLSEHRSTYIGAEKLRDNMGLLPRSVQNAGRLVSEKDPAKGKVLQSYFWDMLLSLREMNRVLKPRGHVILVAGPSTMKDVEMATHEHLAELMRHAGFDVVGIAERALDRDRRLMPVSRNGNGNLGIQKRIHREYVIGAVKE